MKKAILVLCISSLFLGGCSTIQNSSTTDQQQQWQEKNIKSNINALNQAPQYKGKIRVTSEINNGDVLLMGQSINDETKQLVEAYVQNLQGVKKTYNQIRLGSPISFDDISYDIWLTTRVKSALLSDNRLDQYSIKATTENKEVFLMGNISKEKAQLAADIASKIEGVSKVVKAFNYTATSSSANIESNKSKTNEEKTTQNDREQLKPTTVSHSSDPIIQEIDSSITEADIN